MGVPQKTSILVDEALKKQSQVLLGMGVPQKIGLVFGRRQLTQLRKLLHKSVQMIVMDTVRQRQKDQCRGKEVCHIDGAREFKK